MPYNAANTKTISLAFGNMSLELDIPKRNISSIILPSEPEIKERGDFLIKKALENPIKSKRLSEIVNPNSKIAIIVSDITRPTPTGKILPPLLEELYLGGTKAENITIIFALGLHRNQTEEESRRLVGEEIYKKIRCIQHDTSRCRYIGTTSRGTPVEIFENVLDADLVIGTGSIEFHYYAGYSGGAKSVLPGVSSKEAVIANHKMMIDEKAVSGRVDGPVRQDMEEAAKIAGLDFILNVVLDSKKEIVAAVAGDFIEAHRKGVEVVDSMYKVPVEPANAVIVSCGGFPKDINLFQASKALDNATQAVKTGGSIILVAECAEGIGNQVYECWNRECRSPDDAIERFKQCFEFGGHKTAIIAKISKKFKLYLVSKLQDEQIRSAFFTPMASVNDALSEVFSENPDAKIHLMPHGGQTLPVRKEGKGKQES
ncbi:Nickel-dependent lactate racemase [Methanosarcina thermophila]|jgi:nickel-dependent lactate racemase|uniref:Nickel-dependent lactate racemase n=3 Tax=Methanosarcina thermophila TaxID=2210 RepID=A0A1I6XZ74_METTE|nr:nickel-dependent lactate racemase [Methanosarcina thermophila]ALK05791.1 MAG: transcriptional regulator [Methanosarcina sp. 795]AKB12731.1 Transcriptional regulator [Methanosarcina thermophila TM-1]AKB16651.1 Transcriptional regulator [Methanosarcina thermophila CHTI-55]NLU56976.1 nickel-dependent lactate racemase [Methanosarcina thermophila]SFT43659.1 Nickel-dependent lactate racemase [Methanosarcina thermophila]